jgi:hypothetical protein
MKLPRVEEVAGVTKDPAQDFEMRSNMPAGTDWRRSCSEEA